MRAVALIPARAGSTRIPGKNIKLLQGHPLLAYTVRAAIESQCFEAVLVNSDSMEIMEIARHYGASPTPPRPAEYATKDSPDIEWVRWLFGQLALDLHFDTFSILRPTNPFRTAKTIQRAMRHWQRFRHEAHSLRAVEPVRQHPGKMWHWSQESGGPPYLEPFEGFGLSCPPSHSRATQTLPVLWAQNASLEIAHCSTVMDLDSISGDRILAFRTSSYEGFDLNTEHDWLLVEALLSKGKATLPELWHC